MGFNLAFKGLNASSMHGAQRPAAGEELEVSQFLQVSLKG
jgi:hypothetical protein